MGPARHVGRGPVECPIRQDQRRQRRCPRPAGGPLAGALVGRVCCHDRRDYPAAPDWPGAALRSLGSVRPSNSNTGHSNTGHSNVGTGDPQASSDEVFFHERRAVPWWWWAVAFIIIVPTVEAVVVLGPEISTRGSWLTGIVTFAITVEVIAVALLALSRSDVDVDARGLHAGGELLPAGSIGSARALDRTSARLLLGRDARADARMSIRPWVHTAVQVEVLDRSDRAPYWVVATRRPEQLASTLRALRLRITGDEAAVE